MPNITTAFIMDVGKSKCKLIGCPDCAKPMIVSNRTLGVICNTCEKYVSVKDAITPESERGPHVRDDRARKWIKWRESIEKMAYDSLDGTAQRRGSTYYTWRRIDEWARAKGLNA